MLSSPHTEISPPRSGHRVSLGHVPSEDDKPGRAVAFSVQQEHSGSLDDGDCEEKGKRDSFEKERSPAADHSRTSVSDSWRKSPKVRGDGPRSPGLGEAKSPVPRPQSATSPAERMTNGTEGSETRYGAQCVTGYIE